MSAYANIKSGSYRNQTIQNVILPVLKPLAKGKKGTFITVDGSKLFGPEFNKIRVRVDAVNLEMVTEDAFLGQDIPASTSDITVAPVSERPVDDETRMKEISERFEILDDMTNAMMAQKIRGMIISGPPGVGKSFGVERQLDKINSWTDIGGRKRKTEVVKGAMTALGLYAKLHEFKDPGDVVVFDDCDSVLLDDLSLNLLKAALDSGRTRKIYWNAESNKLSREDIPNSFEFKGSVCFITNINFENVRSKRLQDHLQALMSRCHYLDLTLNTMRDKMLRVKQIAKTGVLFSNYKFSKPEQEEILEFMFSNRDRLREVSLRMALKIADCRVVNGDRWQVFARATCMKNM